MVENTITYLEKLVRETQKSEAGVMTMAFQTGLRQLWREHILGQYLRREISRDEAVGIDWVDLAEHQHTAFSIRRSSTPHSPRSACRP